MRSRDKIKTKSSEVSKDQRYFESVLFGLVQEDAATARSLACELSHLFPSRPDM